jgi:sec-independent protein translocase protein TatA
LRKGAAIETFDFRKHGRKASLEKSLLDLQLKVYLRGPAEELLMGSLSLWHWLIVLVVVLLIFGPRRLAEFGKSFGQGVRSLKRGLDGPAQDSSTKTGA